MTELFGLISGVEQAAGGAGVRVSLNALRRFADFSWHASTDLKRRAAAIEREAAPWDPALAAALAGVPQGTRVVADQRLTPEQQRLMADSDARMLKIVMANESAANTPHALRDQARLMALRSLDPTYAHHLLTQAGPEIARLGRWFAVRPPAEGRPDRPSLPPGQILAPGDAAILGAFGTAIAAASRNKSVPAALKKELQDPKGDKFSHAMLVKHGPEGKHWDPRFLSEIAKATLVWRRERPFQPGTGVGKRQWWSASFDHWMGGAIDHTQRFNAAEKDAIGKALMDHDPAASVLTKVSQNLESARLLASDQKAARDLVMTDWTVENPVDPTKHLDLSEPAGKVVVAATADRTGSERELSSQAAFNLFKATFEHRELVASGAISHDVAPSLTRGLATMGLQHIPALKHAFTNDGESVLESGDTVLLKKGDMAAYLTTLAKDPTALGIFRGGVDRELYKAAKEDLLPGGAEYETMKQVGHLAGMVALAASNEQYTSAKSRDEANARAMVLFDLAWNVGKLAGVLQVKEENPAAAWLNFAAEKGVTELKAPLFDTGNGARAAMASERDYEVALANMRMPVAQAMVDLANEGKIKWGSTEIESASGSDVPPVPEGVFRDDNARLSLTDDAMVSRFNYWFGRLPSRLIDPYSKARAGFEEATTKHKVSWYA
ncbi:hypothetical protein [Bailinhaonella thermotolerans]|uniref:hypothetical protein n=1 Tax=Bailinhaonella thermotolerans TaxID=1070861 RepID=UPI00192A5BF7|nr:hypothetical protein [Bailinhaonella thermotolerans]